MTFDEWIVSVVASNRTCSMEEWMRMAFAAGGENMRQRCIEACNDNLRTIVSRRERWAIENCAATIVEIQ